MVDIDGKSIEDAQPVPGVLLWGAALVLVNLMVAAGA